MRGFVHFVMTLKLLRRSYLIKKFGYFRSVGNVDWLNHRKMDSK
jgi:hypothetical protein